MWELIIRFLLEKSIVIFLVLGIVLLILGTVETVTIKGSGLGVSSTVGRVALSTIGGGLVLFAVAHTWFRGFGEAGQKTWIFGFKPGIVITSPVQNQTIHGGFTVEGTYKKHPKDCDIRLIVASTDENRFWPQARIIFNQNNKTWHGQIYLWDEPRDKAYFCVVELGQAAQILCDYYYKAGAKTHVWTPLDKMAPDITEHARVCVKNG